MKKQDCKYCYDSHSCYWCAFKTSDQCPLNRQEDQPEESVKGIKEHERTRMKIIVELELIHYKDIPPEKIEKDIRMAEDQIGWYYDYEIKSVEVS